MIYAAFLFIFVVLAAGLYMFWDDRRDRFMNIIPPLQPLDSPLMPLNPPLEPVEKPLQPIEPPLDPIEKPMEPIVPPIEPVDPAPILLQHPLIPLEPPVEPVNPPLKPIKPPISGQKYTLRSPTSQRYWGVKAGTNQVVTTIQPVTQWVLEQGEFEDTWYILPANDTSKMVAFQFGPETDPPLVLTGNESGGTLWNFNRVGPRGDAMYNMNAFYHPTYFIFEDTDDDSVVVSNSSDATYAWIMKPVNS